MLDRVDVPLVEELVMAKVEEEVSHVDLSRLGMTDATIAEEEL